MKELRLRDGNYYGQLVRRDEVAGFILTETVYRAGAQIPSHAHANAYFCVVLQGAYTEAYNGRSRECRATTLAFHPPEEVHSERFRDEPVRSFNVEIPPVCMARIAHHCNLLDHSPDFNGGTMGGLGIKLYREFIYPDSVSPLAIEGLVLEILAQSARKQPVREERRPARWLECARDLLQSRFAETLTVSEVARQVSVHPVHLAREFRKHYGCTMGDFVRRLRVDFACGELVKGDRTLAELSLSLGFFDQSHFCRTFKALTGVTPGEYRATCRPH
jgi:AraC family transcriptional regulator